MIFKILQTFVSKALTAVLSLLLVVVTARYGGMVIRGEISLFITNQAVIVLFTSIIGGPSIVYLTSKVNTRSLFLLAYLWALASSLFVSLVILLTGFVSYELYYFLLAVSFLSSLFSVNIHFLLGYRKINAFNLMNVFQVLITFMLVCYFFLWNSNGGLYQYIISLLVSYTVLWLFSLLYLASIKKDNNDKDRKSWYYYFNTGFKAQLSNLIQFLNYRLSYYFIALLLSKKDLGLFSTCVIITESVWLISSSLATIGFSKISSEKDLQHTRDIIFQLFRLNILLTLVPILVLTFIPDKFYTYLLGPDFHDMKAIVSIMLIGAFILSVHRIIATYFSGTGKFYINNIASLIGLLCNIVFMYFFLLNYQLIGVAIASTLTYCGIFVYSFYNFSKITHIRLDDLKFKKTDLDIAF
jgi:O-antigen/teichoic acid export membrane protein